MCTGADPILDEATTGIGARDAPLVFVTPPPDGYGPFVSERVASGPGPRREFPSASPRGPSDGWSFVLSNDHGAVLNRDGAVRRVSSPPQPASIRSSPRATPTCSRTAASTERSRGARPEAAERSTSRLASPLGRATEKHPSRSREARGGPSARLAGDDDAAQREDREGSHAASTTRSIHKPTTAICGRGAREADRSARAARRGRRRPRRRRARAGRSSSRHRAVARASSTSEM